MTTNYFLRLAFLLTLAPLPLLAQHFRFAQTDVNHSLLVTEATLNGESLVAGDEIGVFNPGNVCGGAFTVDNNGFPVGIAAWQVEGQNPGFRAGDRFAFRFWDSDEEREVPAQAQFQEGDEVFTANGFSLLRLSAEVERPAQIQLSESEHHFGQVTVGNQAGWSFSISNVGGADLTVGNIASDNDAFSTDFPDEGWTVAPGESFDVAVTFTPSEVAEYEATLTIASNDPDQEEVFVALGGAGIAEPLAQIVLDPREVNFGAVDVGAMAVAQVRLGNEGEALLEGNIAFEGRTFNVDPSGEFAVEPGESIVLDVSFTPDEPVQYEGSLVIVSNDPNNERVEVPLSGRGIPVGQHFRYQMTGDNMSALITEAVLDGESLEADDEIGVFTPDGLCAGGVTLDGEWPVGMALWGEDPSEAGIQGFRADEAILWRYWDRSAGEEFAAEAEFIEGENRYQANGFIAVRLSAHAGESPRIRLNEEAYDFGRVAAGDQREWMLVVGNSGNADLTVEEITLNGEAFDIAAPELPALIAPGAEIEVGVNFAPPAGGEFAGSVVVLSDDPDRPRIVVQLAGFGVEDAPPAIELSTDLIDFGEVRVSRRGEASLRISNAGGSPLQVERFTISPAVFTLADDGAFALGVGESRDLTIYFEPDDEAQFEGRLTIFSDDPDRGEVDVALTGQGAPPLFHWDFEQTDNNMSLLITDAMIEGDRLPDGSEIGVFTPRGTCAGAAVVHGFPVGLAAWGDDFTTQEVIEGFRADEEISWRIWLPGEGLEVAAEAEYEEGEGLYSTNSLAVLAISAMRPRAGDHFLYRSSDANHSLLILSAHLMDEPLEAGDEVGVFTPGNVCAGAITLEEPGDQAFGLAAWGDEAGDNDVLGFRAGESFAFRYWDADAEREWVARKELVDGEDAFEVNGFTVFRLTASLEPRIVIPDRHDFGAVNIGAQVEFELEIHNAGEGVLTVSAVAGDNEAFQVGFEGEQQVDPGGYFAVAVIFAPDAEGRFDGRISIESDDPDRPVVQVPVTGTGFQPNRPPRWDQRPEPIRAAETDFIDFDVEGSDPDGDDLAIRFGRGNLPEGAAFTDRGDGTGFFEWQTGYDDAGEFRAMLTLTDGEFEVEAEVIIVIDDLNRAPIVVQEIEDLVIDEDAGRTNVADLDDVFADPDGDDLQFSVEGGERLNLRLDDNNVLSLQPDANFNGEVEITVTADDGRQGLMGARAALRVNGGAAEEVRARRGLRPADGGPVLRRDAQTPHTFGVTVRPVNDPPVWTEFPDRPIEVREGDVVRFDLTASDIDGDDLRLTLADRGGLPDDAAFQDNGDGSGTFVWQTGPDDAGEYDPVFRVSDGEAVADVEVTIVVTNVNRSPVITEPVDDGVFAVEASEAAEFVVEFAADDPDGDDLVWQLADTGGLPDGWEFTGNGDGTAAFRWMPTFDDAGEYRPLFVVEDPSGEADEIILVITVNDVNRPPVIREPTEDDRFAVDVNENAELRLPFRADDPDGDDVAWRSDPGNLPEGWEFTDNGDGTAEFLWTPTFDDEGQYTFLCTAVDAGGESDEVSVLVTVNNVNRGPELDGAIEDVVFDEDAGSLQIAELSAVFSDPDGDVLEYAFAGAPGGLGMGIRQGSLLVVDPAPNFHLAGGAQITVTARDPSGEEAATAFRVTVRPVNDAPGAFNLLAPDDGTILADFRTTFRWTASNDVDGDAVNYSLRFQFRAGQQDTTLIWQAGVETELAVSDLDTLMRQFGIRDTLTVVWRVEATDGVAIRPSATSRSLRIPPPTSAPANDWSPYTFALQPVYPNPFNPRTTLAFTLDRPGEVALVVRDLNGRQVALLDRGRLEVGRHLVEWDAAGAPAGLYIFELRSEGRVLRVKGALIR